MARTETAVVEGERREPYLDELKQLRDEIRLQIHLGGMDAHAAWRALEEEVEHALRGASEMRRVAFEHLLTRLRELSTTLARVDKGAPVVNRRRAGGGR